MSLRILSKLRLSLNNTLAGLVSLAAGFAINSAVEGQAVEKILSVLTVLFIMYILTGGGKLPILLEQLMNLYSQFKDIKAVRDSEAQLLALARQEIIDSDDKAIR